MFKKDNKIRLFEMMERIDKTFKPRSVVEDIGDIGNLPPGIDINDFISLDDYIKQVPCSTNIDEIDDPLEFGAKMKPVDDVQNLLTKKGDEIKAGQKQNYETGGRINAKTLADIQLDDKSFDIEKLKKILTQVPSASQLMGQNTKMGKSNFFNITLPAFKGLIYNQKNDKFYVINVCDKAGECTRDCYAQMGRYIIYDAIIRLNTQKLNYLLNNWNEWKSRIITNIKQISFNGNTVIRWHDSGDFISEKYLQIAFDIAKNTPNDFHYAYTKEVGMVLKNDVPDNFEFKFSYGGKEDKLIDKQNKFGYSIIVPEELFKDLKPKETGEGWNFTPESINILMDRIVNHYKIDKNVLVTNIDTNPKINYQSIKNIPYDTKAKNERRLVVVNWHGNDDIPALRKDVLAVYNLKHR